MLKMGEDDLKVPGRTGPVVTGRPYTGWPGMTDGTDSSSLCLRMPPSWVCTSGSGAAGLSTGAQQCSVRQKMIMV